MMKLNQTLNALQEGMTTQLPAEILSAFGESLQQLTGSHLEEKALNKGDIAPNFTMRLNGESLTLSELLKNGSVVINFFRGNWCPFCMAELAHYEAQLQHQTETAVQYLFISPQKEEYHTALMEENNLKLQFISDEHNVIAKQFGLVFQLDDKIQEVYRAIGADLSEFNGDDSFELPMPATYLIDPSGEIIDAFVHANYMLRAEPEDVLAGNIKG